TGIIWPPPRSRCTRLGTRRLYLVNTAYAEPRIRTRIVVLPQRVAVGFMQADTVLARCSYRATATASDTTPEAVDGRSSPLGRGGPAPGIPDPDALHTPARSSLLSAAPSRRPAHPRYE